jgi:hypothetical protein
MTAMTHDHEDAAPAASSTPDPDGTSADSLASDAEGRATSVVAPFAGADGALAPVESWTPSMPDRRTLRAEMWLVLWVSIAATALGSLLSLVDSLTQGASLASQSQSLVVTYIADRPWLDVLFQASHIGLRLVPVLLVIHLLRRTGEGRQAIGLDMRDWRRDVVRGVLLAAILGGLGLAFYLLAYKLGMNVRIAAVTADRNWWTPILLVASASYNAILEEVIVLAYFLHRASQLGWKPWQQVGGSALVRAAYHLYQGFGGFLGNLAMGTVFAILYRRWGRAMPFVWAHLFIDATAFLGYYYLGGHLSWLP